MDTPEHYTNLNSPGMSASTLGFDFLDFDLAVPIGLENVDMFAPMPTKELGGDINFQVPDGTEMENSPKDFEIESEDIIDDRDENPKKDWQVMDAQNVHNLQQYEPIEKIANTDVLDCLFVESDCSGPIVDNSGQSAVSDFHIDESSIPLVIPGIGGTLQLHAQIEDQSSVHQAQDPTMSIYGHTQATGKSSVSIVPKTTESTAKSNGRRKSKMINRCTDEDFQLQQLQLIPRSTTEPSPSCSTQAISVVNSNNSNTSTVKVTKRTKREKPFDWELDPEVHPGAKPAIIAKRQRVKKEESEKELLKCFQDLKQKNYDLESELKTMRERMNATIEAKQFAVEEKQAALQISLDLTGKIYILKERIGRLECELKISKAEITRKPC